MRDGHINKQGDGEFKKKSDYSENAAKASGLSYF